MGEMDREGCAASNQGRGREPPDGHLHNGREPLPSSGHACSGARGGVGSYTGSAGTHDPSGIHILHWWRNHLWSVGQIPQ
uniref:Uncharacterized protein n=1 Tax=Oryza sativa subsp. japonica TaxID=39947 RepID=Q67VV3_ORYSJ|nr:hypothetical protein [Oryza sativa Japonica Group]BAD37716.1 hypothetical protein [Oryza sativa Japonica Group]